MTTPFSQSALPSKSLLSRENTLLEITSHGISPSAGSAISAALPQKTQQALNSVIRRLFERCFQEGAYHQVIGIAVEAKNLDILREAIVKATEGGKGKAQDKSGKREELMDYLLDICLNVIQERALRNEVSSLRQLCSWRKYLVNRRYRFFVSSSTFYYRTKSPLQTTSQSPGVWFIWDNTQWQQTYCNNL